MPQQQTRRPEPPCEPQPLPPPGSAVKVLNSISLRVNLNVNEQSTKRESEEWGRKRGKERGRLVDKMLSANVSIKSTAKNLIFFHLARNVEMNILPKSATQTQPPPRQKRQRDRYLDR